MDWKRQGAGFVSAILLRDGREGRAVLVGSRDNPKGAMLVLPGEGSGDAQAIEFSDAVHLLLPRDVVELLCAQERAFGASGLSPLEQL
jgi:hypothetical protein